MCRQDHVLVYLSTDKLTAIVKGGWCACKGLLERKVYVACKPLSSGFVGFGSRLKPSSRWMLTKVTYGPSNSLSIHFKRDDRHLNFLRAKLIFRVHSYRLMK